MGKHSKFKTEDYCVADAVSGGYSELEELASECREMFDNASEGLQQTQRLQTFEQTADTLEGLSEPDVPECVGELRFQVRLEIPNRPRRGLSRATRCANATALLQGALDAMQAWLEENSEHDDASDVEDQCNGIENDISEAEGAEFPGMYG